jgi:hypothetical protein
MWNTDTILKNKQTIDANSSGGGGGKEDMKDKDLFYELVSSMDLFQWHRCKFCGLTRWGALVSREINSISLETSPLWVSQWNFGSPPTASVMLADSWNYLRSRRTLLFIPRGLGTGFCFGEWRMVDEVAKVKCSYFLGVKPSLWIGSRPICVAVATWNLETTLVSLVTFFFSSSNFKI